jgi:hypothetical protein|tara:strand:- start:2531 stop:3097 length:567 start_codon:yes stop_codon:yes gene_type:complete
MKRVILEFVRLDKEAFMPAGEQLRQRATQFAVKFDEVSHVWRILDTWDKTLENLQSTDEIPDAHPAMNILPMAAMIEVVRAAESLNLLEHMFGGVSEEEFAEVQEKLTVAEATVTTLEEQLELNRTEDIKDLKDIYKDAETIQTQVPQVAKDPLSDQSQVAIAAIQALTQITGQSQLDKVVNGRTINT